MAQDMIQLVYVSEATQPFTAESLEALARGSAENNQTQGITGFLVHHDGHFFQVLEGDRAKVEALYAKIEDDDRHQGCRLLYSAESDKQVLTDWFMRNVSLQTSQGLFPPEVFDKLAEAVKEGISNKKDATRAVRDFVRIINQLPQRAPTA